MVAELGRVLEHYEQAVQLPLPEKFPKPTRVHAHQGEPCPRCETTLEAVFYEDYVMSYYPQCQTEGRVLKDRRSPACSSERGDPDDRGRRPGP